METIKMEASTKESGNTSTRGTQTEDTSAAAPASSPACLEKTFGSLSTDLKSLILSYIIRPSDLVNVCLVSKLFHSLAVRYLYKSMYLELGSQDDNRIAALLNPNNIGLKHVRQIHLHLVHKKKTCKECCHEKQAVFATRMLVELLPENILEEFNWCPWAPFSADIVLLLFRKQKRMKWLEVMNLDRPLLPELQQYPRVEEGLYTHTRTLALYPEDRDTLQLSGRLIEKTSSALEELILHTNFDNPEEHSPGRNDLTSRELNDSAAGPGLVTSTVFAHLLPFDSCKPLSNLTSLRLHKVSLRQSADTWCKFINFSQITHLRLFHCVGTDTLIDNLCRAVHLPKKLQALEIQQCDNPDNELLLALDGFLCLVSGLRLLILDLQHVNSLPAAAGITRHGKTLECLVVHASNLNDGSLPFISDPGTTEQLVYSTEDFDQICTATRKLEQLSCAWPQRNLFRDPDEHWTLFETSARKLRNLVTLHITTWPSATSAESVTRMVYETLMKELARTFFETFHERSIAAEAPSPDVTATTAALEQPSKLNLIAFGISDKIYDRKDSKHQLLYLRSKAFDAESREQIAAAAVGWCARQFLEPRSEILDIVLDRDLKMPVRRDRGGVDGIGERRFGGVWGEEEDV